MFFEIVRATAARLPETRFAIVEPTKRPGIKWYNEGFESLREGHSRMLAALGLFNISVIKDDDLTS